jgi:anti-sigma-K factor RskA
LPNVEASEDQRNRAVHLDQLAAHLPLEKRLWYALRDTHPVGFGVLAGIAMGKDKIVSGPVFYEGGVAEDDSLLPPAIQVRKFNGDAI